ncbi:hypothetical protein [Amycolatopsis pittospori]|uniref:hypothetical protein n=1 Tax=Amycolatopsis pittospori TaxID=2749434 RepID=UPI0015EFFD30|nr:hypothetical protein [Amycolatopsis pittospori]
MAGNKYLTNAEYKKMLEDSLNDFHKALTKRWMEDAVDAMTHLSPTVPCSTEPWAWQWPAESYGHLSGNDEICGYLTWVMDGLQGNFRDVHCQGWNPQTQKYVECHVERNLAQIERLAWNRRQEVAKFVPQLEGPDLTKVENAHNTYLKVAGNLGFHDSNANVTDLLGQREVVENVQWLAGRTGEEQLWFTGWTGLAAATFKAGFFASVAPTLRNQSLVLASLATLYSTRATTIEVTRRNIIRCLNWATPKLDEKVTVKDFDLGDEMDTLDRVRSTLGVVMSLSKAVSQAFGPIGTVLGLVGYLGGIAKEMTHVRNAMSLQDILSGLDTAIHEQHLALDSLEEAFNADVTQLQRAIAEVHSYNLELYDLTANTATGQTEERKFHVEILFVLKIAKACFDAAESYSEQLRTLVTADAADRHLSGRDWATCTGDDTTLEIRDAVEQFMRTACARFLLAGEQVMKAAEAYANTDAEKKETLQKLLADWREEGIAENRGRIDPNPETTEREDPGKEAEGTDRTNLEPRKPGEPTATNPYEKDRQTEGDEYKTEKSHG